MKAVYEELKEEFKKVVLKKGELSRNDIIEWCKKRAVGILTLTAIIEDLEKNGVIKVVYDDMVLIDLPKCVKACMQEVKKDVVEVPAQKHIRKTPRISKSRKKTKRKDRVSSLITQFLEEEPVKESSKIEEVEIKEKVNHGISRSETVIEENEKFFKEIKDENYRKALMYLAKYRSIGNIRFIVDLQKNGVKDVQKIIRRMIEEGYAKWSPLGVINATDKLPRVKSIFTLADVLS
ncbi:MAG: hypothetical protein DRJ38_03010 [Thermoprotei archaeon]|nr:MAG: hypothetical protein DRJ38_03010 [Thermoprotei archaeon]